MAKRKRRKNKPGKQGGKSGGAVKPNRKTVSFDFSPPQERDETIKVEGFESFSIRFQVPDGASNLDSHVAGSVHASIAARKFLENKEAAESEGTRQDILSGSGSLMIRYILAHLKWWSFPQEISWGSLLAMATANVEAVAEIYYTISK